jgi:predicted component of type VI protein secretion system
MDLTLMQQARKCLVALQEELDGVVETTSEITAIMTQVDALQAILGTAKKPVRFVLSVDSTAF